MSYALQITQSLNWIVRQTVEVETNIVSVERVLEYANLPSEAPDVMFKSRPSIGWPAHGQITFKDYSTRYREGLDPVLKDINLSIKAREKIGVVGRTGAGKSSLTLALFRIIEPISGHIRYVEALLGVRGGRLQANPYPAASTVSIPPPLACWICEDASRSYHKMPHFLKEQFATTWTPGTSTMIPNCGACLNMLA
jgi:hypothetical protein